MARSPAYPAVGLSEAVDLVGKVFQKEQRTAVTEEVAVQAMGYSGLNGKTRTLISALKKYGLVTEVPGGDVRVSDLALAILHPANDSEADAALQEAAFNIELFRELAETHLGASDAALRSNLIRRSFTEQGAQQAIASFRDTIRFAKLGESRYASDEGKDKEKMSPLVGETPVKRQEQRKRDPDAGPAYTWPLPNGREIEIRVNDGALSKGDLSFLRRYLEVVEDTLQDGQPLSVGAANDDEVDEGAL